MYILYSNTIFKERRIHFNIVDSLIGQDYNADHIVEIGKVPP